MFDKAVTLGKNKFKKGDLVSEELLDEISSRDLAKIPVAGVDEEAVKALEASCADQIHVITSYSIHYTKLYETVLEMSEFVKELEDKYGVTAAAPAVAMAGPAAAGPA